MKRQKDAWRKGKEIRRGKLIKGRDIDKKRQG